MKLLCFPNFTGGALVCELLNPGPDSPVSGITYGKNLAHHIFKIGDNGRVYRTFDETLWLQKLDWINRRPNIARGFLGTHCHPSVIPDEYFNQFQKVMAITTVSELSKYYRFLRCCWDPVVGKRFTPSQNARSVLETFEPDPRCINIEFEHIVDGSWVESMNLDRDIYYGWRKINSFLYTNQAKLRRIFDNELNGNQNS